MNRVSGFRLQGSARRSPSSVFCLLSSVLLLFTLTVLAQEDRPGTLTAPSAVTAPAGKFIPLSAPKKEAAGKPEQELLRDPFWSVGFFPPNWQRKTEAQGQLEQGEAGGWTAAAEALKKLISGTSRLGDRTAAVINGGLKSVGDPIEVLYDGKMYQWEIIGIDANGQIQLKKIGIR